MPSRHYRKNWGRLLTKTDPMVKDKPPRLPIVMMLIFVVGVIVWLTYLALFGFGGDAETPPVIEASSTTTSSPTTTKTGSESSSPTAVLGPAQSEAAPPFLSPTSLPSASPDEGTRSTVREVSRARRTTDVSASASTTTSTQPMPSESSSPDQPTPETPSPEPQSPPETSPVSSTENEPPPEDTGWQTSEASWYGPGFYGNRTACGQTYSDSIPGVAHKTLACGTLVTFRHAGRSVTVPVIDRGPYTRGRTWDLSARTCRDLGHCWTGAIEWRLAG